MGKLLLLTLDEDAARERGLAAARVWLSREAPGATVTELRARAARELRAPRDVLHRRWSELFLASTEAHAS